MLPASYSNQRKDKQCHICHRLFVRSGHLSRHLRTHSDEKPFPCSSGNQSFRRLDVRNLHIRRCHENQSNVLESSATQRGRKRTRVACTACRRRKTRCSGGQPCSQCVEMNDACTYRAGISSTHSRNDAMQHDSNTTSSPSVPLQWLDNTWTDPAIQLPPSPPTTAFRGQSHLPQNYNQDGSDRTGSAAEMGDSNEQLEAVNRVFLSSDFPASTANFLDDAWILPDFSEPPMWLDYPDNMDQSWDISQYTTTPADSTSSKLSPDFLTASPITSMVRTYFLRKAQVSSLALDRPDCMWYSKLPTSTVPDAYVVNVFLNIFRRHIPPTFSLFRDMNLSDSPTSSYYMAMAAVGGLFCSVRGSYDVARALYNDSRRILLTKVNCTKEEQNPDLMADHAETLQEAKTFILLEIYGLCSGDRRSYEFSECMRSDLMRAVRRYTRQSQCTDSGGQLQNMRLFECLHVLNLYRVILMRRPATLTKHDMAMLCSSKTGEGNETTEMSSFLNIVESLATPGLLVDRTALQLHSITSLGGLSSYLWPATRSWFDERANHDEERSRNPLWKKDFIALACVKWWNSQQPNSDPSLTILYHCIKLLIHADIELLVGYFRHSLGKGQQSRNLLQEYAPVCTWLQGHNAAIATWHANSIFSVAEGLRCQESSSNEAIPPGDGRTEPRVDPESPHIPYAITMRHWFFGLVK
ncbi:hypothetical protein BB8028_0011g00180 [Beauveria bassiana]|uniref:Uncharacterized protein n=1 Tax=Beauveria bassiana TaxID=176275 RepID=A0A2S7YQ18_BEABA|nr:hypothetical protein BB8028_0011g00180 [Beauveria bassiana]